MTSLPPSIGYYITVIPSVDPLISSILIPVVLVLYHGLDQRLSCLLWIAAPSAGMRKVYKLYSCVIVDQLVL